MRATLAKGGKRDAVQTRQYLRRDGQEFWYSTWTDWRKMCSITRVRNAPSEAGGRTKQEPNSFKLELERDVVRWKTVRKGTRAERQL